jgi:glycosyltransferase involved in cell wall biosynthesis
LKLIIQIPCFNEEKTLPLVLANIPTRIDGIKKIETLVIDDGSNDNTVEIARKLKVDHIIRIPFNKGLGNAFKTGVEYALSHGADILVNTDGDNQYNSAEIAKLVKPIVDSQAEIVIGNRQTNKIKHFSFFKKVLQRMGSMTVAHLSGIEISDAVTGFRAYSKSALQQINVTSDFSYTLDTIIQAGKKNIKLMSVDINTNPPTRASRLFGSMWEHVFKSAKNLALVYIAYEPINTFFWLGTIFCVGGIYPMMRFIYFFFNQAGAGHIQSLIVGAMCVIVGFQMYGLGIIGVLFARQRKITEEILNKIRKQEYEK